MYLISLTLNGFLREKETDIKTNFHNLKKKSKQKYYFLDMVQKLKNKRILWREKISLGHFYSKRVNIRTKNTKQNI